MTRYDYFMTLTFDKENRDLKCFEKKERFEKFIVRLKELAPQMEYMGIPEYTVDGVFHYHVLTSGITPQDIKCVQKAIRFGKWFYDVVLWGYGCATMVKLDRTAIV